MPKHEEYTLTPLAAAIVEALPDRKLADKIKSDFRRRSVCPVSAIFDEAGVEEFYRERNTTTNVMLKLGVGLSPIAAVEGSTAHLKFTAYPSNSTVTVGTRFSLALEVEPGPNMHVYAPGAEEKGYRVIGFNLAPTPLARFEPVYYPASEIYHFQPLVLQLLDVLIFFPGFCIQLAFILYELIKKGRITGYAAPVTLISIKIFGIKAVLSVNSCDLQLIFLKICLNNLTAFEVLLYFLIVHNAAAPHSNDLYPVAAEKLF